MIDRTADLAELKARLERARVVLLIGPRQCGKTTLARQIVDPTGGNYFDLEDPTALERLTEPMTALAPLRGTVVIDEVQRRPELFSILRVLADRQPLPAKFLVLGSAQPGALRQASQSLTGRITVMELGGLRLTDLGSAAIDLRWFRGGFPNSILAPDDRSAATWLGDYARTIVDRDLPAFDVRLGAVALQRFLAMLAHRHGSIWQAADPARSLGISQHTVRRYLDLLTDALIVRQLPAWFANISKRQVKAPKVFIRDAGLAHSLLSITSYDELLRHPSAGATWEGFLLEEIVRLCQLDNPLQQGYFWRAHTGAELDLYLPGVGRGLGIEIKRADAPRITPSMRSAINDLGLERLLVVYPGSRRYTIGDRTEVIPATEILSSPSGLSAFLTA
jgi:uncharacterized protein